MRVNLFSGPGAGKSKLAHFLADTLGRDGFSIELSPEVIKPRAYRKAWPSAWENFSNIMAPQLEQEREWLESGVAHVVTDSPLFIQCYYMAQRNAKPTIACLHLARAWEEEHPAVNLFLERNTGGEYEQVGRYQDLKEAQKIDASMKAFLENEGVECEHFDAYDRAGILAFVREALVEGRPTPVRLAS